MTTFEIPAGADSEMIAWLRRLDRAHADSKKDMLRDQHRCLNSELKALIKAQYALVRMGMNTEAVSLARAIDRIRAEKAIIHDVDCQLFPDSESLEEEELAS